MQRGFFDQIVCLPAPRSTMILTKPSSAVCPSSLGLDTSINRLHEMLTTGCTTRVKGRTPVTRPSEEQLRIKRFCEYRTPQPCLCCIKDSQQNAETVSFWDKEHHSLYHSYPSSENRERLVGLAVAECRFISTQELSHSF